MIKHLLKLLLVAAMFVPWVTEAQNDSCTLKIVGEDSYADGWNDAYLSVMQGGTTIATFDAENADNDGEGPELDSTFVTVASGVPVSFVWSSGFYDSEVTIWIYNSDGVLLYTVNNPSSGTLVTLSNACSQCYVPSNLIAMSGTDEITVSWTPGGNETSWLVNDGTTTFVVNDTFYTFYNLAINTAYTISVAAFCSVGDTSMWTSVFARTLAGAPISDFPYSCGFETSDEVADWVLENGTQTNQWVIDSAVSNGGLQALYISNDNGGSNSYSTSSETYVFAYAAFVLDAGSYAYSFDWRAYGESSFDFLRAALVPASTEFTAGSYCGFNNTSVVPAGGIALDGQGRLNLSNNWMTQNGTFDIATSGTYKMVFLWRNDGSIGTQPPAAIDNVMLTELTCSTPANLTVNSISDEGFTVSWQPGVDGSSWVVMLDDQLYATVNDTFYTFTGLDANTVYNVKVATYCGAGDTSFFIGPVSARTLAGAPISDFPYSCGFETSDEVAGWIFENGSQLNQWVIDSAVSNGGDMSLYISNDNGGSNSYSTSSSTYVFAYANFDFDAGSYTYSYDWRAYGESSYDFIRAAIVPASTEFTAGSYCGFNNSSAVPAGGIAIDGQYRLNLSSDWVTQNGTFDIATSGTYKMVFLWHNDGSGGAQPPAAIDNIIIGELSCPTPTGLTVVDVTTDEITVSWNGSDNANSWQIEINGDSYVANDTTYTFTDLTSNTLYTITVAALCADGDSSFFTTPIMVRTSCGEVSIPYNVNFDDMVTGEFASCWTNYSNTNNYVQSGSGVNSSNALHFQGPGIVITPRIPLEGNQIQLECDLLAEGSSSGTMEIGFTTDPVAMSDYVAITTAPNITSFTHYSVTFDSATADTGYVVFKQVTTSTIWYWWLDNLSIFTALPCSMPSDLAANASQADSVVLTWTGSDDASSYNVVVLPASATFDADEADYESVNDTYLLVDTLTSGQQYKFYVSTDCGSNGNSYWAGPYVFVPGAVTMPFNGSSVLYTCSAFITDNGGASGSYANSSNDTLYVYPSDPGMALQISGHSNTESCCDYVYVYEGIGTNGTLIFDGHGAQTLAPYVVLGGPLTIRFHSDGSIINEGFELMVNCVTPPDCFAPTTLSVLGSSATDVTVGWNGPENGDFQVTISGPGYQDSVEVTAHSYTFTGLASMTTYTITVSSLCDDTLTGHVTTTVTTPMVGVDLPYMTGFEDGQDSNWTLYSTGSNVWVIDTAVSNGGSKAMYISNDGGVSNNYSISSTTYSYATKAFNFATNGEYEYSFDWRAYGESNYDYLRVFLVPSTVDVTSASISTSGAPSGWISLDGGNKLNLSTDWQTYSGTVMVNTPSTYVMLFYWRNDNSVGTQPPAAVDNIYIQAISCPRPTAIVLDTAYMNSVTFHWVDTNNAPGGYMVTYGNTVDYTTATTYTATNLSSSTVYTFKVYSICGAGDTSMPVSLQVSTSCGDITLPYFNDFESYGTGTGNFPMCWTNQSGTSNYVQASYGVGNSQALHFQGPGVVVTPRVPIVGNRIVLSASLRAESTTSSGTMHIGFTTDPTGLSDYQEIVEIQPQTSHVYYSDIYFDSASSVDTGYVVFRQDPGASTIWYWWLDDLIIDDMGSCPKPNQLTSSNATQNSVVLSWNDRGTPSQWIIEYGPAGFTPGTGTTMLVSSNPYTLTGLAPSFQGDFYVRALCGYGDTSAYQVNPGVFATTQTPASLPYSYDFENAGEWNNWQTSSNNAINWYRGTAVASGNSQYSMYVSTDAGLSYTGYENNLIVNAVAYRDIDFGSVDSSFIIGFKARVGGTPSGVYDGLLIALVDPTTAVSASDAAYTSPWGYVGTFDYLAFIRLDTTWQEYAIPVDTASGIQRLVFYWFNYSSSYYSTLGEAAAIDDITVDYSSCPRPLATTVDAVGSTSASLSWQGPSSANYIVVYRQYPGDYINNWVSTNTNHITLTGLDAMSQYVVWVLKDCGGDTSLSSNGILFQTGFCDGGEEYVNYDANASESTSSYTPIGWSYYNYGYVQTIIPAERLGDAASEINAMAFNTASTTGGTHFTGMSVWMANVSEDDLSAGFIMPDSAHDFVQVIDDADFNYSSTGWQMHTLDTNFAWDGQSNILVTVVRDHGSYTSGSSFVSHQDTVARTRYLHSDYEQYSIYDVDYDDGTASTNVGDIKLISCGAGCPRPSVLYASDVNYGSAVLHWSGTSQSYQVSVKAVTEGLWPAEVDVNNATSYTVNGLMANTTYQFRVRTLCDDDMMSDWAVGTFVTDSLPCFAPTDLTVMSTGYTSVTLDWTTTGNETAWSIRIWNTNFDTSVTVSSHPATVGGLLQNFGYMATVAALCGNGSAMSEMSESVSFSTTACEQVTDLTVSNITGTSAVLTWSGNASSYEVDYGGLNHGQGTGTVLTVNGTSCTLTGLLSDSPYSVFVRAICQPGVVGAWSTQVDFYTTDEAIDIAEGQVSLNLFPNPTHEATTITLGGVSGEVTVAVVDMNGRVVMSDVLNCDGGCEKRMEVAGLAQGAYFVRVSGENLNMVKKLIVK